MLGNWYQCNTTYPEGIHPDDIKLTYKQAYVNCLTS
jgi:hypothetical protein